MAIRTGLDCMLLVDGVDMTADTGAITSISRPRQTFDKCGLRHAAYFRIGGKRDGGFEIAVHFNPAAAAAHATWKTLPRTNRNVLIGTAWELGAAATAMPCKQIGYDGSRPADGDLTWTVSGQLADGTGVDDGKLLTAGKRTDTTATNGTGVDQMVDSTVTGSYAFGLQAWLQVEAFTGTNCTIKLQESSDNGVGDAWADVTGGAFTVVTAAPFTQRLQTSLTQTVERYLRVVTAGTFSSITFAAMAHRNEVAYA